MGEGGFQVKERDGRSVLEQSNLDELIQTVEIKKEEWSSVVGEAELINEGPTLVTSPPSAEAERAASRRREVVSIPRRPAWHEGMTVEELAHEEAEAFMEWRRGLAHQAEKDGFHLTPYERNLDFWRQLWRCVERSDLLVQIVDSRDPDFYYCRDLTRYVAEVGASKRLVLLVNKADFLSPELRAQWVSYFQEQGVDALFFSALREVKRQQKAASSTRPRGEVQPEDVPVPDSDDEGKAASEHEAVEEDGEGPSDEDSPAQCPMGLLAWDDQDVLDSTALLEALAARLPLDGGDEPSTSGNGTIGFVGYPNVGKSTVINALLGTKKVGMSKTPGKTKHIQTLEIAHLGITLCDCPGLVFPSVVATRAHLVINNTVPLDDLKECFTPVGLIIKKVGLVTVLAKYDCAKYVQDARDRSGDHWLDDTHAFLAAFAVSRNHFLRVGVPDENWAARKVLRDYVSGELLHCEPPPEADGEPGREEAAPVEELVTAGGAEKAADASGDEDDDFADLDSYLKETASSSRERGMTKRKARYLNKLLMKGTPVKNVGNTTHRGTIMIPTVGV